MESGRRIKMGKRIFWTDTIVETSKLADWLTILNLHPNKFHLIPIKNGEKTIVIYVEREVPNVE